MQAFMHLSHAGGEAAGPSGSGKAQHESPRSWRRTASWSLLGALLLILAVFVYPCASVLAPVADAPGMGTQQVLGSTGGPAGSVYFASTGKAVKGSFLSTFQRFGLDKIGYPISEEALENGLTVQYFERVRMEYHPELANKGYSVLMTRLGAELSSGSSFARVSAFNSTTSKVYVRETGHSLSEPFLSYWNANGGVELFGYPISEQVTQDGLRVQWFERARMEYHPELAKGKQVLLTQLGKQALDKKAVVQASTAEAPKQAAAPAPAPAPALKLAAPETSLLTAINEQRAGGGLKAVQLDATLTDIARTRTGDMATRNYFSHTTPDGHNFLDLLGAHSIGYKQAGEILARNNYDDNEAAQVAMNGYLNSPPHKSVIFDGKYNYVGVGYTKSDEDGMQYFCVVFIQR